MFLKKETEKGLATWFALISSRQPSWTTDERCRSQYCFYCFSLKTIPPPAWGVPAADGNPERVRSAGDSSSHTEPPKPTFNYRATGGSGSHTVRQSQRSTTGPLGAAVLTQADRTNVQLQGRWGQRFNYRPTEPMFNYRAAGGSGSTTGPLGTAVLIRSRQSQCSTTGSLGTAVLIRSRQS